MGRYRSGQTGQTVNLLAYAFACSNHARPTQCIYAEIAQLVEQLFCKQRVAGSNPVLGSEHNTDTVLFFIHMV